MRFASVETLLWLWAIPLLVGVLIHGLVRRRALLARFAERQLWPAVAARVSVARPALKWSLVLLALGAGVIGLARPQWNPQPKEVMRSGRDVCFVIDVSRSMLAEDLAPSRLERSKLWVRDVLRTIEGDRVAIVAFAGNSVVKCPLTHDYGFARTALDDLSPTSVSRGGTLIGDAIRVATGEVFDSEEASYKDLILITDGEDHESFPVEAATQAGEAGVRLIAIGIGDENAGQPIPIRDEWDQTHFVEHNGQRVLSRLDADTLREMVARTDGGVYFNVARGSIELDRVYEDLVAQAARRELASIEHVQYEEKFQIFIGLALALLMTERLISERRRG